MNALKRLADECEQISKLDFAEAPNVKFRAFLLNKCCRLGVPMTAANPTIIKMNVSISEFDEHDDDWNRIMDSYALMLRKIYDIYGDNMIHLEAMSITHQA